MTDPFDALREALTPVDPDPLFAERLRARLERALLYPTGDPMTMTTYGDVAYASVWTRDAGRAAAFYSAVLGWRFAPGGHHVEGLGQSLGVQGGLPHLTTFCCFGVDDVADAVRRVREAGGQADEPAREPYGLASMCADDQGMSFAVIEYRSPRSAPVGPGEIAYLTVKVPDTARARAFFGAVLGWRFAPGRVEDGWQVEGVQPMIGLSGGVDRPVVVPMYAVDDVREAAARVRAAGGTSTEPEAQPYGVTVECADDQGAVFHLGQF